MRTVFPGQGYQKVPAEGPADAVYQNIGLRGHPQAGQPVLQTRILKDTLNVLATAKVPGEIVDLPYHWGEPFDWKSYRRDVEEMLIEEGQDTQNWAPKM